MPSALAIPPTLTERKTEGDKDPRATIERQPFAALAIRRMLYRKITEPGETRQNLRYPTAILPIAENGRMCQSVSVTLLVRLRGEGDWTFGEINRLVDFLEVDIDKLVIIE